jgi:hypothetical protein
MADGFSRCALSKNQLKWYHQCGTHFDKENIFEFYLSSRLAMPAFLDWFPSTADWRLVGKVWPLMHIGAELCSWFMQDSNHYHLVRPDQVFRVKSLSRHPKVQRAFLLSLFGAHLYTSLWLGRISVCVRMSYLWLNRPAYSGDMIHSDPWTLLYTEYSTVIPYSNYGDEIDSKSIIEVSVWDWIHSTSPCLCRWTSHRRLSTRESNENISWNTKHSAPSANTTSRHSAIEKCLQNASMITEWTLLQS